MRGAGPGGPAPFALACANGPLTMAVVRLARMGRSCGPVRMCRLGVCAKGIAMAAVRAALDGLYRLCGVLAAACLVAILGLILLQVVSRLVELPFRFVGGPNYAGYAMAGASFLGFAYALNHGAHIRVTLALGALGRLRWWGEVWCYAFASLTACLFAFHAVAFTYESWCGVYSKSTGRCFPEISQGLDATPLWIPQLAMAFGALVLAIAFLDNLVTLLVRGRSNIVEEELDEASRAAIAGANGANGANAGDVGR